MSNTNVSTLIGELKSKVDSKDLPKLMAVLHPIQTATALKAFGAVQKGDTAMAEDSGRTFLKSITAEQWPKLEVFFGAELCAKLKAVL